LLAPSKQVWAKYIEHIDRLRARGEISAEDEILLRQHYEAGRTLVEETFNDPATVTDTAVTTVLERVKEDIRRPLQNEAADLRADHAMKELLLESQAQLAAQETEILSSRLSNKVRKISAILSNGLYWLVIVAIAVLLILSFLLDWGWIAKLLQGLALVALLFGSLLEPIRWLRERVRAGVESGLRRMLELDHPERTPSE
jgi:hypothetical protein